MFMTDLDLRACKANEWVLLSDLVWRMHLEYLEIGIDAAPPELREIAVPRGFITDLASIPRTLRPVLNVNGPSRAPAVLHDYLYCSQRCSRADADKLLRFALACEGVGRITRNLYYAGVRLGGWVYYGKRKDGLRRDDFWESHLS